MDGLIKCSIVPPEAVSSGPSIQMQQKVHVFSCVGHASLMPPREECVYTKDEERALTVTWEMDEVRLAVEKDYRLVEIYEVHEYQVTQYNPVTGEGGIFVD